MRSHCQWALSPIGQLWSQDAVDENHHADEAGVVQWMLPAGPGLHLLQWLETLTSIDKQHCAHEAAVAKCTPRETQEAHRKRGNASEH